MNDQGILFSAAMVRGLVAGRKTETRRIANPQNGTRYWQEKVPSGKLAWFTNVKHDYGATTMVKNARFVGDRLYVREAWGVDREHDKKAPNQLISQEQIHYFATDGVAGFSGRKRSSMHMPRWASRINLTVTDVVVERLQDISDADAIAEGIFRVDGFTHRDGSDHANWSWQNEDCSFDLNGSNPRDGYSKLWDFLNGDGAWDANPWVVVTRFTVEMRNIDN